MPHTRYDTAVCAVVLVLAFTGAAWSRGLLVIDAVLFAGWLITRGRFLT